MNSIVMDIMREIGTPECVLRAELPRATGLRIDPRERFETRPVIALLKKLTDAEVLVRRGWLLEDGAEWKQSLDSEALYEYAILLVRELNSRRLAV